MTSAQHEPKPSRPSRRRFLTRLAGVGAVGWAGALALDPARAANAYYQGPVSDHFDGVRFFNPGGQVPNSLWGFLRWNFATRAEAWPSAVASPHPQVRTKLEPIAGGARLLFIGHASFLIELGGLTVLIDPVFADRASPVTFAGPLRANPPGIAFDALPKIDVVLVSHNHYDHLDVSTLGRLWQRDRPHIITPLGNDTIMKSAIPGLEAVAGDWGQSFPVSSPRGSYRVHMVPTQHWSARGVRDRLHALWASFVLTPEPGTMGPIVYAVGDSGFGDGRTFQHVGRQFSSIDTALLPIGAYEPRWFMQAQHMNPDDAVKAFQLCGARQAFGHHWGTFKLTNEGHERPVEHLAQALALHGLPSEQFQPLRPGQMIDLAFR